MKFLRRLKKKLLSNLDYVLVIAKTVNKFQDCIQIKILSMGSQIRWFKKEDILSSTVMWRDWYDMWIDKEELRKKRL